MVNDQIPAFNIDNYSFKTLKHCTIKILILNTFSKLLSNVL